MSDAPARPVAPSAPPPVAISEARRAQVRWSLLFGNFVIGCGVMVVVGTLVDIAQSLAVSISVAGQLVAAAAVVMCFGAPLLAGCALSVWAGRALRRTRA